MINKSNKKYKKYKKYNTRKNKHKGGGDPINKEDYENKIEIIYNSILKTWKDFNKNITNIDKMSILYKINNQLRTNLFCF